MIAEQRFTAAGQPVPAAVATAFCRRIGWPAPSGAPGAAPAAAASAPAIAAAGYFPTVASGVAHSGAGVRHSTATAAAVPVVDGLAVPAAGSAYSVICCSAHYHAE